MSAPADTVAVAPGAANVVVVDGVVVVEVETVSTLPHRTRRDRGPIDDGSRPTMAKRTSMDAPSAFAPCAAARPAGQVVINATTVINITTVLFDPRTVAGRGTTAFRDRMRCLAMTQR